MVTVEGRWARWRARLRALARPGRWLAGAALAAAVLLLAVFFYRNWPTLWGYVRAADYRWLVASFFWYTLDLILAALGWAWVMRGLTGPGDWRKHFTIYCVSNVGRRLPGTFWYVAGRTALYQAQGVSVGVVSLASGLEYILLTAAAIVTVLVGLPFGATFEPVLVASMGLGLILALVCLHPRFIRFILNNLDRDAPAGLRYRDTLAWVIWYLSVWAGGGVLLYTVIRAFYPLPLANLPFVISTWAAAGVAASVVFLAPSGLGVTELSLSLLLSAVLPVTLAVGLAVFLRLLVTFYELVWAIVAWLWIRTHPQIYSHVRQQRVK